MLMRRRRASVPARPCQGRGDHRHRRPRCAADHPRRRRPPAPGDHQSGGQCRQVHRERRRLRRGQADDAWRAPAFLRFDVRDTGVGVPAAKRQEIFEEFVQADSSHARKFGGTGLGLAISKRLVETMGGEIGVDAAPEGGSCFWFTLPAAWSTAAEVTRPLAGLRVAVVSRNRALREGLYLQIAAARRPFPPITRRPCRCRPDRCRHRQCAGIDRASRSRHSGAGAAYPQCARLAGGDARHRLCRLSGETGTPVLAGRAAEPVLPRHARRDPRAGIAAAAEHHPPPVVREPRRSRGRSDCAAAVAKAACSPTARRSEVAVLSRCSHSKALLLRRRGNSSRRSRDAGNKRRFRRADTPACTSFWPRTIPST